MNRAFSSRFISCRLTFSAKINFFSIAFSLPPLYNKGRRLEDERIADRSGTERVPPQTKSNPRRTGGISGGIQSCGVQMGNRRLLPGYYPVASAGNFLSFKFGRAFSIPSPADTEEIRTVYRRLPLPSLPNPWNRYWSSAGSWQKNITPVSRCCSNWVLYMSTTPI